MSRIIFCATVAFLCCGLNSFGQDSGLNKQSGSAFRSIAFPQATDIPNPFEFSRETESSAVAAPQAELPDSLQDPTSLPVTRQHHERTVVDTIVDHSMLMNTPHASYEPVEWCQSMATPNPIGEIMLREFCVQGLWDGYEAQRAHLCAHMWHKLSGHHCGSCGPSGSCCPPVGCNNRSNCGPVQNRYRAAQPKAGCSGNCGVADCEHCAQASPIPAVPVAEEDPSAGSRDYFAELKNSVVR